MAFAADTLGFLASGAGSELAVPAGGSDGFSAASFSERTRRKGLRGRDALADSAPALTLAFGRAFLSLVEAVVSCASILPCTSAISLNGVVVESVGGSSSGGPFLDRFFLVGSLSDLDFAMPGFRDVAVEPGDADFASATPKSKSQSGVP